MHNIHNSIYCYALCRSLGLSEIELCPLFCLQETSSYKIAARPERRRQFEIDLCSSANVAIDLLTACMAIDQLKEQVYFLVNISMILIPLVL